MAEFIHEEIEVRFELKMGAPKPLSFKWRSGQYQVSEILMMWEDHTIGTRNVPGGRFWERRHRNYYVVRTSQGEIMELYFNRERIYRNWILYRKLDVQDVRLILKGLKRRRIMRLWVNPEWFGSSSDVG